MLGRGARGGCHAEFWSPSGIRSGVQRARDAATVRIRASGRRMVEAKTPKPLISWFLPDRNPMLAGVARNIASDRADFLGSHPGSRSHPSRLKSAQDQTPDRPRGVDTRGGRSPPRSQRIQPRRSPTASTSERRPAVPRLLTVRPPYQKLECLVSKVAGEISCRHRAGQPRGLTRPERHEILRSFGLGG